jgi:hypothetical protein
MLLHELAHQTPNQSGDGLTICSSSMAVAAARPRLAAGPQTTAMIGHDFKYLMVCWAPITRRRRARTGGLIGASSNFGMNKGREGGEAWAPKEHSLLLKKRFFLFLVRGFRADFEKAAGLGRLASPNLGRRSAFVPPSPRMLQLWPSALAIDRSL